MLTGQLIVTRECEPPYAHAARAADGEDRARLRLPTHARHALLLRVRQLVGRPPLLEEVVHCERVVGESTCAEQMRHRRIGGVQQSVRLHVEGHELRVGVRPGQRRRIDVES